MKKSEIFISYLKFSRIVIDELEVQTKSFFRVHNKLASGVLLSWPFGSTFDQFEAKKL
jgi:hypothetical protein